MTLSEFKHWLEGFEESFVNGRPSDLQWKKIKEKLEKIAVSKPVSLSGNKDSGKITPNSPTIPPLYPYEPYKVWY